LTHHCSIVEEAAFKNTLGGIVHGTLYGTSTWYVIWYKYMVHYMVQVHGTLYMVQVHGTLYGTSTWYVIWYKYMVHGTLHSISLSVIVSYNGFGLNLVAAVCSTVCTVLLHYIAQ